MSRFMMRQCLLLLVLAVVCQSATLNDKEPGSEQEKVGFCTLECPGYEVLCTTDDYEVRRYESSLWVSTVVTDFSYVTGTTRAFWRLFNYITGENEEGITMEMTQPVLVTIPKDKDGWFFRDYVVSFMIPRVHWDNPPLPTDSALDIERRPEEVVFVQSSRGWLTGWNANTMQEELVGKLQENGEVIVDEGVITATYQPPYQMTDRHNEIWVLGGDGYIRGSYLPSCLREANVGQVIPVKDVPDGCDVKECAPFSTVERKSPRKFIERTMTPTKGVCITSNPGSDWEAATYQNYLPLYQYLAGQNSQQAKIDSILSTFMMMPTDTFLCEECTQTVTTCLTLPKAAYENPPQPKDERLFIFEAPTSNFYLMAFSGYPTKKHMSKMAAKFMTILDEEGVEYTKDMFFATAYDDFTSNNYTEIAFAKGKGDGSMTPQTWEKIAGAGSTEKEEKKTEVEDDLDILPTSRAQDVPPGCQGRECPVFKTVKTYDGFVERAIKKAKWVCMHTTSCNYESASLKMFYRLLDYTGGQNSAGVKMDTTTPILTWNDMDNLEMGDSCGKQYRTCVILPEMHQDTPPTPSNDEVYVYNSRGPHVYVMPFGGYATNDKIEQLARKFRSRLDAAGVPYKTKYFKVVVYDGPQKVDRYNEIWFQKPRNDEAEDLVTFDVDTSTYKPDVVPSAPSMWERKCKSSACPTCPECPKFDVIRSFNNFDERKTPHGTWVDKKFLGCSTKQGPPEMLPLFRYMSGTNTGRVSMERTSPLMTVMWQKDNRRFGCDKDLHVAFWVPEEHDQGNPPYPIEEDVTLYKTQGYTAYVMSFSGPKPSDSDLIQMSKSFMGALDEAGIKYKPDWIKLLEYDGPEVEPEKRLDELWMVKKEE
ncbi:uncharacterized protein [Branchiostoma lanceolatum]|uniref:uncharacterized protein isoform X1 n=2 Tax=Branchiostoma lanceolatum TaxID=7740 RepID=UPI003456E506